ncbi:MAG TPA: CAP domain-containing protein [Sphingomicrobium sp.]|nr:CAP domain-containing protein [Sphingomicrobium sp.]
MRLAAAVLALALAGPAGAGERAAGVGAPQTGAQSLDPRLPGATGELSLRLLAAHNRERALVGHAPLRWDPDLAAAAAAYGPVLASLGRLVHSPREIRAGQSENLARAWHGTLLPEQLVDLWSREKHLLQPGRSGPDCPRPFGCLRFPAVSNTGRWEDVGHYTQMVWPTTTRVGCAIFAADWDYLICRYSPKGNVDGKLVFAPAPVQVAQAGSPAGR